MTTAIMMMTRAIMTMSMKNNDVGEQIEVKAKHRGGLCDKEF